MRIIWEKLSLMCSLWRHFFEHGFLIGHTKCAMEGDHRCHEHKRACDQCFVCYPQTLHESSIPLRTCILSSEWREDSASSWYARCHLSVIFVHFRIFLQTIAYTLLCIEPLSAPNIAMGPATDGTSCIKDQPKIMSESKPKKQRLDSLQVFGGDHSLACKLH